MHARVTLEPKVLIFLNVDIEEVEVYDDSNSIMNTNIKLTNQENILLEDSKKGSKTRLHLSDNLTNKKNITNLIMFHQTMLKIYQI